MTEVEVIRSHLALLLADQVFERSPVLARLLTYLVEESVAGRGKELKSYSVAVEGLGRPVDFDPQADSYARVQVARLRRALDAFYATAGKAQSDRLQIDHGSYQVRLVPVEPIVGGMSSSISAVRSARLNGQWLGPHWRNAAIAAVLLAAIGALLFLWLRPDRGMAGTWLHDDFPSIEMTINEGAAGAALSTENAQTFRRKMLIELALYESLRVKDGLGGNAKYRLKAYVQRAGDFFNITLLLIDRPANRIVWSWSEKVPAIKGGQNFDHDRVIEATAFMIGQPTGILHANERKIGHSPYTPYGCWLGFLTQWQENFRITDQDLNRCVAKWYHYAPQNPNAASFYSWALIDRSVRQISEARRLALIEQAISVAEEAQQLNPNSAFANLAVLRGKSYAGRVSEFNNVARKLLAKNTHNLDARGVVGMLMVMQNDMNGMALLQDAIQRHFNPPAWYYMGAFVAALMQDDVKAARAALVKAGSLNHSLPILNILRAAVEARSGHLAHARTAWAEAEALQPALKVAPDRVIDRLPLNQAIRQRLREWLVPVMMK